MFAFRLRSFASFSALAAPLTAAVPLVGCVSKSKHEQHQRHLEEAARVQQLREAVEWCTEDASKPKGGWAGAHRWNYDTGDWWWPLVTEGSLNRRLKNPVLMDHPFAAHQVLTPDEEADLVATCKELANHGQPLGRDQVGKMVHDALLLRPVLNEGRNFAPYSTAAKHILKAGEVGQAFFARFFEEHPEISERKPCSEETLRARWMTREVSARHFEKLSACLARAGLLDDLGRVIDPRRVLNSDECPNPWRGTGERGKVIAEVGQPCVRLVSAAREHSSLDVLVGLDGHLYGPHLIFKGEYMQRQMIPRKEAVGFAKVSATKKGYQTGSSLLDTLRFWDRELTARGVPKPVVWTTDGHSSRLNRDVLQWCRDNQWIMYISPPHTTGIHQALDQIFKAWHDTFNGIVKRWCEENAGREVTKAAFTAMFEEAWPKWTTADKIVAAFRRVGVSVKGLDPKAVPESKFVLADTVARPAPTPSTIDALTAHSTPLLTATTAAPGSAAAQTPNETAGDASPAPDHLEALDMEWESPSPPQGKYTRGSIAYWRAKAQLAADAARSFRQRLKAVVEKPLTLKATHPDWQVKKAEHPAENAKSGSTRLKGEWGDMDNAQMLEKFAEQDAKEEEAQREADARKRDLEARRAEREQLARAQADLKAQQREFERPVLDLLHRLEYTSLSEDDCSARELALFAAANRKQLRDLGVDVSSTARKALMPQLVPKIAAAPSDHPWKKAPPKALMPPAEGRADPAALMPPPPPRHPSVGAEAATDDNSPIEPAEEPTSAHSTPTKPPDKRPRRAPPPPPAPPPTPPDDDETQPPWTPTPSLLAPTVSPGSSTQPPSSRSCTTTPPSLCGGSPEQAQKKAKVSVVKVDAATQTWPPHVHKKEGAGLAAVFKVPGKIHLPAAWFKGE
jgi:hypothetical protein